MIPNMRKALISNCSVPRRWGINKVNLHYPVVRTRFIPLLFQARVYQYNSVDLAIQFNVNFDSVK